MCVEQDMQVFETDEKLQTLGESFHKLSKVPEEKVIKKN